jgi:hypothetical protein
LTSYWGGSNGMNEAEWMECTDPTPMLDFLRAREMENEKKLRRFALACCYRTWRLMPDDGKQLLEMMEQFAEGNIARHQRDFAVATFRAVHGRYGADTPILRAAYRCKYFSIDAITANIIAKDAAVAAAGNAADFAGCSATYAAVYAAERAGQVNLLRCIFGNPFRTVGIESRWLTTTVLALAKAAYDHRILPAGTLDNDRLAVLADALEDADCDNADILGHCRQAGPHVRGCWLIDLLTGKE